jgi:LacI family transcriptional regulator
MVPAGPDHRYVAARNGGHARAVFLDRPPGMIDADTVLSDDAGGARAGIEHLLAQGHSRIAFVGDSADLYTAAERLTGYRAALAAAGIGERPELVKTGNSDAAEAQQAVAQLLALPEGERPTALLAANNRNTVGAIRALAGHDRSIALVGFDDFELADVLRVTVVRSDPGLMGERAASIAFARLDGDDRPPQRVVIPTALVPRGSGEVAP